MKQKSIKKNLKWYEAFNLLTELLLKKDENFVFSIKQLSEGNIKIIAVGGNEKIQNTEK